jgi:hypothetical protein
LDGMTAHLGRAGAGQVLLQEQVRS